MHRLWLVAGSLAMLVGLMLAAATGHGTDGAMTAPGRHALDTARELLLIHALALVAVGLARSRNRRNRLMDAAGTAFLAGIVMFPGAIHAVHLLGLDAVRPVIPVGGMTFMLGWALFALGAWRGAAD
jgi:uncharacterized membrane protein YgdD (TMEM256/DUF423 family)